MKLAALAPLPVLAGQGRLDGQRVEGEIRGSKPDGGTERESILGGRNCREKQRERGGRGLSESCDITSRPSE